MEELEGERANGVMIFELQKNGFDIGEKKYLQTKQKKYCYFLQ